MVVAIMVTPASTTAIITGGALITVIAIVGGVGAIATADAGTGGLGTDPVPNCGAEVIAHGCLCRVYPYATRAALCQLPWPPASGATPVYPSWLAGVCFSAERKKTAAPLYCIGGRPVSASRPPTYQR